MKRLALVVGVLAAFVGCQGADANTQNTLSGPGPMPPPPNLVAKSEDKPPVKPDKLGLVGKSEDKPPVKPDKLSLVGKSEDKPPPEKPEKPKKLTAVELGGTQLNGTQLKGTTFAPPVKPNTMDVKTGAGVNMTNGGPQNGPNHPH